MCGRKNREKEREIEKKREDMTCVTQEICCECDGCRFFKNLKTQSFFYLETEIRTISIDDWIRDFRRHVSNDTYAQAYRKTKSVEREKIFGVVGENSSSQRKESFVESGT